MVITLDKRCKRTQIDWPTVLEKACEHTNDYELAEKTGVARGTITKLRLGYTKDAKFSDGLALFKAAQILQKDKGFK